MGCFCFICKHLKLFTISSDNTVFYTFGREAKIVVGNYTVLVPVKHG